jgi:hypothetical protein
MDEPTLFDVPAIPPAPSTVIGEPGFRPVRTVDAALLRAENEARDAAIERVEAHADDDWKAAALAAVELAARTRETFTGDDVWNMGLPKPREARALGPVMLGAARAGLITRTDEVRDSTQPGCHRGLVRVWRSNVYEPGSVAALLADYLDDHDADADLDRLEYVGVVRLDSAGGPS